MLYELKDKLLMFLQKMKGKNGYYKYSLSGDLYDENIHWGLGNSVFALKLYYMIDALMLIDLDEIFDYVILCKSLYFLNIVISHIILVLLVTMLNKCPIFSHLDSLLQQMEILYF